MKVTQVTWVCVGLAYWVVYLIGLLGSLLYYCMLISILLHISRFCILFMYIGRCIPMQYAGSCGLRTIVGDGEIRLE
jgi:hypothetical protein